MRLKQKNLLRYYQARRRRDKVEEGERERGRVKQKGEIEGSRRRGRLGKHEISAQRMLWQLLPTLPATIAAISKEEKMEGKARGRGGTGRAGKAREVKVREECRGGRRVQGGFS